MRASLVVFVCISAHAQFVQQSGKFAGTGTQGRAYQGSSVVVSADGNLAVVGGPHDNPVTPTSVSPSTGSGSNQNFIFTFSDRNGVQDLSVVNILIGSVLDGRQSCYL